MKEFLSLFNLTLGTLYLRLDGSNWYSSNRICVESDKISPARDNILLVYATLKIAQVFTYNL